MSKILLIVAAALLLGSAGLSFANKGKLATTQDAVQAARQDAQSARAEVTKAKTALTKAQADLKDVNQRTTDSQAELTSMKSQIDGLTAKADAATKAVTEKDAQIAAINKQLEVAGAKNPDAGTGDITKQIGDLRRENEELQVVKNGLDNQVKNLQTQMAAAAKVDQDRRAGILMQGLQGRVLAVDRNWNFVVLNLGDQKGVINGANMIVQRNGSLVGKIRITSVEPSQSIADIVPNSVPPGVSVQAGDTVVFPGS